MYSTVSASLHFFPEHLCFFFWLCPTVQRTMWINIFHSKRFLTVADRLLFAILAIPQSCIPLSQVEISKFLLLK